MNATNQTIDAAKPLWEIAQSKQNENKLQKLNNRITKREYFRVLEALKELYKPLAQWAFERDYTTHTSDKPNPMHCFLTKIIYWRLSCDASFNFSITYSVGELQFAEQFNALITSLSKSTRIELTFEIPVETMFKRAKRLQPEEFFYILK